MSVLEIILYITLGVVTLTWAIIVIVKAIKKKKQNENQRDAENMPR